VFFRSGAEAVQVVEAKRFEIVEVAHYDDRLSFFS
jgi:hypothetical protein